MGIPISSSAVELTGVRLQTPIDSRKVQQTESQMFGSTDEVPKWSEEALQAMETHLRLLEDGAARSVASKKRSCYTEGREDTKRVCRALGGPSALGTGRHEEKFESEMDPLVELNSQVPLPEGWEQFLDLRTGQVYYVDWNSLKRSYIDPRKMLQLPYLSFQPEQDCSGGELQLAKAKSENSECLTDCCSNGVSKKITDETEVESNWTFPMHEEDWGLMNARGWQSPVSDDCSEISSEIVTFDPTADHSSFSSSEAQSEEKLKTKTEMGCN